MGLLATANGLRLCVASRGLSDRRDSDWERRKDARREGRDRDRKVGQDSRREVGQDGSGEIGENGGGEIGENGGGEVGQDRGREVSKDGRREVGQNGGWEVRKNGSREIGQDGSRKVRKDRGWEIRKDRGREIRQDGRRERHREGGQLGGFYRRMVRTAIPRLGRERHLPMSSMMPLEKNVSVRRPSSAERRWAHPRRSPRAVGTARGRAMEMEVGMLIGREVGIIWGTGFAAATAARAKATMILENIFVRRGEGAAWLRMQGV